MCMGNARAHTPQGKSISSFSTCAKASLRISRRPTAQDSGTFTKEREQSLSIPSTLILGSCRCLNSPTCASQPWCARNGTPLSTGRLCSWTLFTSRSALTSNAPTAHAICTLGYCLQQAQFDPTTRCDMHKSSACFHAQVPNVVSARDFHSAPSDTSGLPLT